MFYIFELKPEDRKELSRKRKKQEQRTRGRKEQGGLRSKGRLVFWKQNGGGEGLEK